ncbi:MAG: hypothetical protein BMS9Abin05_1255 [Rhodothermia bacterium]|nr:MAG: hypothetical protein BMS9Abin05_1255 [Rhodothermia bacterium]
MFITGLLTVGAFLLIARAATRPEKSPIMMLSGIAILALSVLGHTLTFTSLFAAVTALTVEFGIGLVLVAGFLARKKMMARPFFYLGFLSLIASVLLIGIGRFVRSDFDVREKATLIVELGPDDQIDELAELFVQFDARYERAFPNFTLGMDEDLSQVFLVSVDGRRARKLIRALTADSENIDYVDLNWTIGLEEPIVTESVDFDAVEVLENDPLVKEQWSLQAIKGHEAHAYLKDLTPVRKARVAIVDTGVDASHEDISSVFAASPGNADVHGHGSHCAGIAGAATNNGVGIASLNWEGRFVEVTGYKALNDQGMGTVESIAQAILDATRAEADIISMSLGSKSPTAPKTIVDAVKYAQRNDVIVIVSAGNSNEDAIDHMPSNIPGVIVVSAVDENLRKASFSNTNTSLGRPIAAPGVNILSLRTRGGYVRMSGTSMSTPVVSGLVGVMRSLNPDLSAEDAYKVLKDTGRDIRDTARIGRLINAAEAIETVHSGK